MKIENIEKARKLISHRDTLLDVLDKADSWRNGHFEFVEHCGSAPNKIKIVCMDELDAKILALIAVEKDNIENELKTL